MMKTNNARPGEIWRDRSGRTWYVTGTAPQRPKYKLVGKLSLDSKTTYKLDQNTLTEKLGQFDMDTVECCRVVLTARQVSKLVELAADHPFDGSDAVIRKLRASLNN